MAGQEIYRSVKLTDDVTPMSLGIMDQLRIMLKRLSNNDDMEIESQEELYVARLRLLSSLNSFFDTAIQEMKRLGKNSVTLKVSSRFLPVLDEVIDKEHGQGRFYDFEVIKDDIPIRVEHTFIVRISRKET